MGCLLSGVAAVIDMICQLVIILVIASIIVSWVGDPRNQIVSLIRSVTEPIYAPFRPLTSMIPGPLDFAPIAVFLTVAFIQRGVVPMINTYANCTG